VEADAETERWCCGLWVSLPRSGRTSATDVPSSPYDEPHEVLPDIMADSRTTFAQIDGIKLLPALQVRTDSLPDRESRGERGSSGVREALHSM
jgi:hypothetical protein